MNRTINIYQTLNEREKYILDKLEINESDLKPEYASSVITIMKRMTERISELPLTDEQVLSAIQDFDQFHDIYFKGIEFIMSDEDWGDSYYAVYKDTCEIKISVPFGKYSICVTKPNYIPYCTSLINTVYIQNENLTGNQTYLGGTIQVGSDVTPYQATGPVIIENGKTQMKALQEVFIKNNFEVQQGAELWIGPLTNP